VNSALDDGIGFPVERGVTKSAKHLVASCVFLYGLLAAWTRFAVSLDEFDCFDCFGVALMVLEVSASK
jgi:hypothetical protein